MAVGDDPTLAKILAGLDRRRDRQFKQPLPAFTGRRALFNPDDNPFSLVSGDGRTQFNALTGGLELINPELDNDLGINWDNGLSLGGTPGAKNSVYDGEGPTITVEQHPEFFKVIYEDGDIDGENVWSKGGFSFLFYILHFGYVGLNQLQCAYYITTNIH